MLQIGQNIALKKLINTNIDFHASEQTRAHNGVVMVKMHRRKDALVIPRTKLAKDHLLSMKGLIVKQL